MFSLFVDHRFVCREIGKNRKLNNNGMRNIKFSQGTKKGLFKDNIWSWIEMEIKGNLSFQSFKLFKIYKFEVLFGRNLNASENVKKLWEFFYDLRSHLNKKNDLSHPFDPRHKKYH